MLLLEDYKILKLNGYADIKNRGKKNYIQLLEKNCNFNDSYRFYKDKKL